MSSFAIQTAHFIPADLRPPDLASDRQEEVRRLRGHKYDVALGRESQCGRRIRKQCGGRPCADVEDHDARTTAGGVSGSTHVEDRPRSGRGCGFAFRTTLKVTEKLETGRSGIENSRHCPHRAECKRQVGPCERAYEKLPCVAQPDSAYLYGVSSTTKRGNGAQTVEASSTASSGVAQEGGHCEQ